MVVDLDRKQGQFDRYCFTTFKLKEVSMAEDKEVKIGVKYQLEKPVGETILYEKVEPHIARVTLNRPDKHNAILTPEMFLELRDKMVLGVDDDDVKVIIVKGAGPSFSSGDDQGRPPFEAYGGDPKVRPPQSVRITKMWQWVKAFNDATVYCPKIDDVSGSAHTAWVQMGRPQPPDKAQRRQLQAASEPKAERLLEVESDGGRCAFSVMLSAHSVCLLEIVPVS